MGSLLLMALPVLVVATGLAVAWVKQERMRERFTRVARLRGGEVEGGAIHPRLVVPLADGRVELLGRHGSGSGRGKGLYARATLPDDADLQLWLARKPARVGALERLGRKDAETGDPAFDREFWMETDDPVRARTLLDEELRGALLAVDPGLRVHLTVGPDLPTRGGMTVAGEPEGRLELALRRLPPREEDLDTMLGLVELLLARLRPRLLRRSA